MIIWEHRDPSMIALGNSGFSQRQLLEKDTENIIYQYSIFQFSNLEIGHGVSSDSTTFIFLYKVHKKKNDEKDFFIFLPKQQTPRPLRQKPSY